MFSSKYISYTGDDDEDAAIIYIYIYYLNELWLLGIFSNSTTLILIYWMNRVHISLKYKLNFKNQSENNFIIKLMYWEKKINNFMKVNNKKHPQLATGKKKFERFVDHH